jgi:PPM family protein phosphatase
VTTEAIEVYSAGLQTLAVTGAMLTHTGTVRSNNEDAVTYILPTYESGKPGLGALVLLADGMGGHAAGEVASKLATDTITQCYYETLEPIPQALRSCFQTANALIHQQSKSEPQYAGMGTTCTAIAIHANHAFLAHIGDSRAYIMRRGCFFQITEDHTLVADLIRNGLLTEEEAAERPDRNVIVRALGPHPTAKPAIWDEGMALQSGDIFLLCSDGLSDLVDNETIKEIVSSRPAFEACEALIDSALQAGGHDNVSVGVFVVKDRTHTLAAAVRATRKIELSEPSMPAP